MKKLSFVDKIIYLLNSLLAILLVLSYLLPFVSPNSIAIFAILSLFVPVLIFLNGLFVIYWLLKLKKQLLLSSLVLTIGFFFSTPFYKISDKTSSLNKDLKVMSYNVKSFDLFHNTKESNPSINGFDYIATIAPDVLLVQEYYQSSKIKLDFPYQYIKKQNIGGRFGMAIYSKFKIINSGSLDLKKTGNNIIFVDILKEKDTIRIYNLHLMKSCRGTANKFLFISFSLRSSKFNSVINSRATLASTSFLLVSDGVLDRCHQINRAALIIISNTEVAIILEKLMNFSQAK